MLAVYVKLWFTTSTHIYFTLRKFCGQRFFIYWIDFPWKDSSWKEKNEEKKRVRLSKNISRSLFSRWVVRKLLYPDPSVRKVNHVLSHVFQVSSRTDRFRIAVWIFMNSQSVFSVENIYKARVEDKVNQILLIVYNFRDSSCEKNEEFLI